VALAISESSPGRTLRRAPTRGAAQSKRSRGRAGSYSDLAKHAPGRDALEYARLGQSHGAQPHDRQPHLASVWFATLLELKTNKVIAQLKHQHRSLEFRCFLDVIEQQVPAGPRGAYHCRQRRNPQDCTHPEMVCQTSTLSCPLHSHLWFLDQPGGAWFAELTNKRIRRGVFRSVKKTGSRHP
jgi:hypothetical protein